MTPRFWASLSLIAGGIWLMFSLLPTALTTLAGLPFAMTALVLGWWSRQSAQQAGDPTGARRAAWALSLGCAGCLWQALAFSLFITALVFGLPPLVWSLIGYLQQVPLPQVWPTPTPGATH
ncbi:MAG: hypothetical protein RMK99_05320 [Anaerolineales bacterium]|nr:hypothetical protein [Anaerolineales bacterium]